MTQHGFNLQEETATRQRFGRDGYDIAVEAEAIDVQRFVARTSGCRVWDLVIAHAVLDLLDLPTTLPGLMSLLRPWAVLFHHHLRRRHHSATGDRPGARRADRNALPSDHGPAADCRSSCSGDSCTGRHLFGHLRAAGVEILDAGSSDWVIFAGPHGYPSDEAYFCTSSFTASALRCKGTQSSIPSPWKPGSPSAMPRSRPAHWCTLLISWIFSDACR